MSARREWLAGALLAVAGVCLAVLVLEAGVRWLHLVPDRFWEPDPILGVRLVPGRNGWWTQEEREFIVPVRITADGRRDLERPTAKPAGAFRVLVLGDSFVEAMHVPLEATLARVLETQLNADGNPARHVEVLAAGVSGYGTASEALYFERIGVHYQPDLVVLAFYPGNDVKNNSPTLEDTLRPQYGADGALERVVGGGRKQATGGLLGSHLYEYVRQTLLVRHPALAQALADQGVVRREALRAPAELDGIPVDYGIYAVPVAPVWAEAWDHTEALLTRLQAAVERAGARLVVAVLSTRDQVYPESWAQIVAAHPAMREKHWDFDAPARRVEAWCGARGVPCIALGPAFRAAATQGTQPLHYPQDGHWTAAGHRLAAARVAEFLEQQRLVPVGQRSAS